MKSRKGQEAGFTLIELLIVIAILTVLFSLVIIAVNPVRQFAQADNTQRRSDINAILNAVYQYAADNRGTLPVFIPSTSTQQIGTPTSGCSITCGATTTQAVCLNLYPALVATYLADIPKDPDQSSTTTTHYAITRSTTNNRITITACDAELSETISITR
jgi:type IV pilus assembly protein PilA